MGKQNTNQPFRSKRGPKESESSPRGSLVYRFKNIFQVEAHGNVAIIAVACMTIALLIFLFLRPVTDLIQPFASPPQQQEAHSPVTSLMQACAPCVALTMGALTSWSVLQMDDSPL